MASDHEQNRRWFLARLAEAAALAGAGTLGFELLGGGAAQAARKAKVVVVRGTDPLRMLKAALQGFAGLTAQVRGKRVVLKPNMSFGNPAAWGNNTSPQVAAAVAQLCKGWGAAHIAAVDHTLVGGARAMRSCGVEPALQKVGGVQIVAANRRSGYVRRRVPRGRSLKTTDIAKVVARGELLINIPVAKQHRSAKVSIGLKNLMGLIWDRRVMHSSMSLHQGIADLATLLRPALTVVDATRVMVSNGPQGPGQVKRLQTIVVSTDPVAADAVAVGLTRWAGRRLTAADVGYLQRAAKLGVGIADPARIQIVKKRV